MKLLLAAITCLFLISCSSNKTTTVGEEFRVIPIDDYSYAGKISLDFKKPRGLAILQDKLYVVDSENHRIAKIENIDSGEPSAVYFSQIGSAPGELLNPQGIVSNGKDRLYIADAGNSRIQVFDADGRYISEHPIKLSDDPSTVIQDVAMLDETHLVFSLNSFESKIAHLYRMNLETGKIENIKGQVTGFLTNSYKGGIYALSKMELFSAKTQIGGKSGRHPIFKIDKRKINEIGLLPNVYTPNDGIIVGDYLYATSQSFVSVDKFTLDGKHLGTIYRPDDVNKNKKEPPYEFTFMAAYKQNLYISDTKNNVIIVLKKKAM